ncbi:hypothetical protein [Thalassotalea sediminis]|uniref:hypothetical protein n=1 Tax=Thalassotalea sediminis TaxID=1759089 RepID=UPI002572CBE3|nr:hypothetical protein [Thalassotalea sediminis]
MSRSIHKTIKGVFGGKSKSTINEMIVENDPEVEALGKKYSYKNTERGKRKLAKQTDSIEKE